MLEINKHGCIREIRLARTPVNALNPELVESLKQALHESQAESEAIVISGLPGVFSAGLDVVELVKLDRKDMTNFWRSFFSLLETIACSPLPVAIAITGHSPAGGAVISTMADYRVMSRGKYKIGLNETRVGLVLPRLLQGAMVRLVGARLAEKMIVAGTLIDPEKALETGLVDALENDYEATIQAAVQWCEKILALPRHAMSGNRAIARVSYKRDFATYTDEGVERLIDSWFSDETQQILESFVAQLKSRN